MVFKDKPKRPPSSSGSKENVIGIGRSVKTLVCDGNFMLLAVCFCCIQNTINTVVININALAHPFGFNSVLRSLILSLV